MINLFYYITSLDFVADLPSSNITIISDEPIDKEIRAPFKSYYLGDILKQGSFSSQDPIIVLCHTIGIQDILTLQKILIGPITRVNLNPWVMSMLTKNNPEVDDIVHALAHHYTVIEPVSKDHFLQSLQPNTYLRVHDTVLPATLGTLSWNTWYTKLINSDQQWEYVVITTPAHIDEVASSLHHLNTAEKEYHYDLYVQHTFSNTLSSELIADLKRTEHSIIILDHKATEQIWMFYDLLLREQTGKKEITIQYIFPQYHLVSSILPEYIYEEAQFDQPSFLAYISQNKD